MPTAQPCVARATAQSIRDVLRGQTKPITTAQITSLLGLPDSQRDTVSSLIGADVRRGRVSKVEVMRIRNLPVNGYTLLTDPMQRQEAAIKAARASHGLDSRRRDRAASIKARRALWDTLRTDGRQMTLPEIALASGIDKRTVSWIVSEMVQASQAKRIPIAGKNAHSHGPRWLYYVDADCAEPREPRSEKVVEVKGFDFRGLMQMWPDPVSIPEGGSARVHTMAGGWA